MNNKNRFTDLPDDLTKAAGIIPIAKSTGRILLNLRGDKMNSPNKFSCWGGYCAMGESPEENALREFKEESGFLGEIKLIKIFIDDSPTKKMTYTTFIGVIEDEFEPKIDQESLGWEWLTSGQLKSEEISDALHPSFKKTVKECETTITSIAQSCLMNRWEETLWFKVAKNAKI